MTKIESMEFSAQKLKLNRLGFWYCIFPILLSVPSAALIYIFQDSITPHLDSNDLCNNRRFLSISFWVLPKISSHCELILNSVLKDHPSSDIVVFLDVVIAKYFVLYSIILVVYCYFSTKNYRAIHEKRVNKYSSSKLSILYLFGAPLVLYSIYFTFFSSDLVSDETSGVSRAFAMFSSRYGIGAALHMLVASVGPFFSLSMTITLLAYNSLHAGIHSKND